MMQPRQTIFFSDATTHCHGSDCLSWQSQAQRSRVQPCNGLKLHTRRQPYDWFEPHTRRSSRNVCLVSLSYWWSLTHTGRHVVTHAYRHTHVHSRIHTHMCTHACKHTCSTSPIASLSSWLALPSKNLPWEWTHNTATRPPISVFFTVSVCDPSIPICIVRCSLS